MRRPIKHVINDVQASKAGNAQYAITLVQGVTNADPYAAAQSQVNAGAAVITHIEADFTVWVDQQVNAAASIWSDFNWYIWFNIAGAQTRPVSFSVGTSDLKNQVFVQGQGKLGNALAAVTRGDTLTTAAFKDFHLSLNIPRWAQKINKDDKIEFVIDFTGNAAAIHNVKVQAIFKEFEQS